MKTYRERYDHLQEMRESLHANSGLSERTIHRHTTKYLGRNTPQQSTDKLHEFLIRKVVTNLLSEQVVHHNIREHQDDLLEVFLLEKLMETARGYRKYKRLKAISEKFENDIKRNIATQPQVVRRTAAQTKVKYQPESFFTALREEKMSDRRKGIKLHHQGRTLSLYNDGLKNK